MNRFDADIALEPAGSGRFRAEVISRWSVGPGPNGGFIAALVARALEQTVTPPLRSLTLHYLAAPALGPIDVAVTVLREGRTTAFARVELLQDDEVKVACLAALSPWRPDAPAYLDATAPEIPGPEDCIKVEARPGQPEMLTNYDMRVLRPDAEARPLALGGWIRSAEPRPLDAPLVAAMTDAWIPPAIVRLPEPVRVPTLDLTIHFRAPLDVDRGEHPFVQARFTSTVAAGGTTEEDGWLWSADGTLLAQSRQLAVVRREAAS